MNTPEKPLLIIKQIETWKEQNKMNRKPLNKSLLLKQTTSN